MDAKHLQRLDQSGSILYPVFLLATTESYGYCIVGKNFDWYLDDGLLVFNKRQVKKTAFVYYNQNVKKPATWISKYGSVTFNMYGVGLPATGMNEKGLIVDASVLLDSKLPSPDDRPSIRERVGPNQAPGNSKISLKKYMFYGLTASISGAILAS